MIREIKYLKTLSKYFVFQFIPLSVDLFIFALLAKYLSDLPIKYINIKVTGHNEHHMIESLFKAFAKAIKMALKKDLRALDKIPTTKGYL